MTDNEKRAHDLTLVMLPKVFEAISESARDAGESSVTIDAYKEYLRVYKMNLVSFNRDFPDGK